MSLRLFNPTAVVELFFYRTPARQSTAKYPEYEYVPAHVVRVFGAEDGVCPDGPAAFQQVAGPACELASLELLHDDIAQKVGQEGANRNGERGEGCHDLGLILVMHFKRRLKSQFLRPQGKQ